MENNNTSLAVSSDSLVRNFGSFVLGFISFYLSPIVFSQTVHLIGSLGFIGGTNLVISLFFAVVLGLATSFISLFFVENNVKRRGMIFFVSYIVVASIIYLNRFEMQFLWPEGFEYFVGIFFIVFLIGYLVGIFIAEFFKEFYKRVYLYMIVVFCFIFLLSFGWFLHGTDSNNENTDPSAISSDV